MGSSQVVALRCCIKGPFPRKAGGQPLRCTNDGEWEGGDGKDVWKDGN